MFCLHSDIIAEWSVFVLTYLGHMALLVVNVMFKKRTPGQVWWLTPVIPSTWEAAIRRIMV
jgi:hypothetical protein